MARAPQQPSVVAHYRLLKPLLQRRSSGLMRPCPSLPHLRLREDRSADPFQPRRAHAATEQSPSPAHAVPMQQQIKPHHQHMQQHTSDLPLHLLQQSLCHELQAEGAEEKHSVTADPDAIIDETQDTSLSKSSDVTKVAQELAWNMKSRSDFPRSGDEEVPSASLKFFFSSMHMLGVLFGRVVHCFCGFMEMR